MFNICCQKKITGSEKIKKGREKGERKLGNKRNH
jgi:hypothetical protein